MEPEIEGEKNGHFDCVRIEQMYVRSQKRQLRSPHKTTLGSHQNLQVLL